MPSNSIVDVKPGDFVEVLIEGVWTPAQVGQLFMFGPFAECVTIAKNKQGFRVLHCVSQIRSSPKKRWSDATR